MEIHRVTADTTLDGVVSRVATVNSDDHYVLGVDSLFVYGDYARGGEGPYDGLFIGIRLSCKWEGETGRYLTELKRDEHRYKDGNNRQDWPTIETVRFLKGHRAVAIKVFGDEPDPEGALHIRIAPVIIQRRPEPTINRCRCGCRARLNKVSEGGSTTYSVGCWGCKLFTKPRGTLYEAVKDWNGGDCYYLRSRTPHTH